MSIAGIGIIIILLLIRIGKTRAEYHYIIFKISILASLFINVGYFSNKLINFSYSSFFMYFYVAISLINLIINKDIHVILRKKINISSFILIFSILISFANIIFFKSNSKIVPMSTSIDDVAYGIVQLSSPVFGGSNISALRDIIIFIIFCYFSYEYIISEDRVIDTTNTIEWVFEIFFILMIIEFIISNFIDASYFRSIVNSAFGLTEKTYELSPYRNGLYSAYGLFTEPSYVASVMVVYYGIKFIRGFTGIKETIAFILSIFVLIISGSSAAVFIAPFGLCTYIYWLTKKNRKKKQIYILSTIIMVPICTVIIIAIINNNSELLSKILSTAIAKIQQYSGDGGTYGSGYARSFGNKVCYNVLETNPIFGVGLGTTRGFGIVPGAIATLGIVGSAAYVFFAKFTFNICMNKFNIILWIIFLFYFCYMFSIWHLYMPATMAIFICFNRFQIDRENNKT